MSAIASILLLACQAIDGDTLRCEGQRYRLLGIDAPEIPGHCRRGRACAPGDPFKSRASLAALVADAPVSLEVIGRDRYGRALVVATVKGVNLSCAQIKSDNAVYVGKWDNGLWVQKACGL